MTELSKRSHSDGPVASRFARRFRAPSRPPALPGLAFGLLVAMAGRDHKRGGLSYEERSEALHELADLAKQPEVSVRKAAELVAEKHPGLQAASLRQALRRHHGSVERTDVHQLLTDDQEQLLLGVIRGFSLANRALSKLQIINLARRHFSLGDTWNGQTWYRGLLHRHGPSLKPRHSHPLSPNRTAKDLLVLVKAWISEVGDFHRLHTFRAGTTWNADETLITFPNLAGGTIRVEWAGKGKSNYVRPRGTQGFCLRTSSAPQRKSWTLLCLTFAFHAPQTCRCTTPSPSTGA